MLRIHQFLPISTVNGPGKRAVVWMQGCSLSCPGCFNFDTHTRLAGLLIRPEELAEQINALPVRGVTLSGGEPLLQANAVVSLLNHLDSEKDILLYSGFSVAEAIKSTARKAVLLKCDAALMGRYKREFIHPYENKELVIRTGRISSEDLKRMALTLAPSRDHVS